MLMTKDEAAAFEAEVDRIRKSGCLGRSQSLLRVFDYLADARRLDRSVREADLAEGVFGRDSNLGGDASIRVYVHRLRKKLDAFYTEAQSGSPKLILPLGEYRLDIDPGVVAEPKTPDRAKIRPWVWTAALAAAMGVGVVGWMLVAFNAAAERPIRRAARSPVWSMIDGKRPVKIVVGDYYIFGELGQNGVSRMVREFDVNSPDDLQTKLMNEPDLQGRYVDLDTTYTPTGATEALQYILPVVAAAAGDPTRLQMITSSSLTPEMLKSDDIVYVGYLSALRLLEPPVFARSWLRIGSSYDDLIDGKTGRVFGSSAGLATREAANIDYGYLRAFRGPAGNHIIVVAGTRDIGVRQMAETAVEAPYVQSTATGVEALYEVRGIGRTNISAHRIDLNAK